MASGLSIVSERRRKRGSMHLSTQAPGFLPHRIGLVPLGVSGVLRQGFPRVSEGFRGFPEVFGWRRTPNSSRLPAREQGFPPAELASFKILKSDDGCFHAPGLTPSPPPTSRTILKLYGCFVCTPFCAVTWVARG